MPKSRFSKDAFKQANEASKGGDFGDIEKGIYVATIEKAKMQETTNGAYQACFGWQISNEDDRHPNAYVWWNQTLTNTNGKPNEIGLQQLNQAYYALSEGAFDPDDFQFDESGEVVNDEEVHEKFFGSIAKIQIIPKGEFNGQTQYQIRIKSIIENKYQGNGEVNSDTSSMVPGDSVELPDDHDDADFLLSVAHHPPVDRLHPGRGDGASSGGEREGKEQVLGIDHREIAVPDVFR